MRYRVSGVSDAATLSGLCGLFELGNPKRGRAAFWGRSCRETSHLPCISRPQPFPISNDEHVTAWSAVL
jgi:hypothetical protein